MSVSLCGCFRARARITSHVWASIHPVWRRCSSFPYEEYAQSSRLARHASQHPNRGSYSCANPFRILPGLVKKANIENVEKSRQPSPRLRRQTCQRRSLPSRVRAVAATTRKRAGRSPFCRAHVLHVRSARQHGCGLSFDKLRTGLDKPPASARACFLTIPSKSD